jgi:Xaa-Pro aminopeptidase
MAPDSERVSRNIKFLEAHHLDAVVATLPVHVRLLTGYWPMLGSAIAIASRDGRIVLVAPEDEREFVEQSWADTIQFYSPGSLSELTTINHSVKQPLMDATRTLSIARGRIAYEAEPVSQPVPYAAFNVLCTCMLELMREIFPAAVYTPAPGLYGEMMATATPAEISIVQRACNIAGKAFTEGAEKLKAGMTEAEIAVHFRAPLGILGIDNDRMARSDGFVYCMSGPNSALAGRAYARTSHRKTAPGDLVLIHCNSYCDGLWTDITRTFCLGEPSGQIKKMFTAIFDAREAALAAIKPGLKAAKLDLKARDVLTKHGFGEQFTHSTGHGVGYAAIDGTALPRLHPASEDVLDTGMIFNLEPSIYIEGLGGIRHCDMVRVTESGAELMTPFQSDVKALFI